jgi:hypothetical protein
LSDLNFKIMVGAECAAPSPPPHCPSAFGSEPAAESPATSCTTSSTTTVASATLSPAGSVVVVSSTAQLV